MTNFTQRALEDAKSNGWNDKHSYFYCPLSGENIDHALLDPAFWQALSKARGWYYCPLQHDPHDKECRNGWLGIWRRLPDHLASGGDIDSFFEGIYKSNE